tara:strand:+ start:29538 stop:29684 length:147 start_codon:yes stop_codon:yes gene_type:complete
MEKALLESGKIEVLPIKDFKNSSELGCFSYFIAIKIYYKWINYKNGRT